MSKALEGFYNDTEQKKERISNLKVEIAKNEKELAKLKDEYKKAVVEDSANVDDLFHQIEETEKKLKADNHKLKTLESVTKEHLKKNAIEVLEGYNRDVVEVYQDKVNKVGEKIKQAKQEYISKVAKYREEILAINEKYSQKTREYGHLLATYGIQKGEINNSLHKTLDDARYGVITPLVTVRAEVTEGEIRNG